MSRREMMKQLEKNLEALKSVVGHCHRVLRKAQEEEVFPSVTQMNVCIAVMRTQMMCMRLHLKLRRGKA